MPNDTLYRRVRKRRVLIDAWRVVRANGSSSPSPRTRDAIEVFDRDGDSNLRRIEAQLRAQRFQFEKQHGVRIKKKGGASKKRPVVMAPVANAVVQRAILDVLQQLPAIRPVLEVPTSFGGVKHMDRSVAIAVVVQRIAEGYRYFIRSDIEGFFTKIPRDVVRAHLADRVDDKAFLDLFEAATTTDLDNLAELGPDASLFPIGETGVAQGSPLSPLIGNILLLDFDHTLNGGDVICLRYIDDFLILGKTQQAVDVAFARAQALLAALGLSAYDPRKDPDKAERGATGKGMEFLGCSIAGGLVKPSAKARAKLKERLDRLFSDGMAGLQLRAANDGDAARDPLLRTLLSLDAVLRSWGHSFDFCTGRDVFAQIDGDVDKRIRRLLDEYARVSGGTDSARRRRVLGVFLLRDTRQTSWAKCLAKQSRRSARKEGVA